MHSIFLIIISLLMSIVAYAQEGNGATNSQFDDWGCYFKSGPFAENYQISSYADNIYAGGGRDYALLCAFDHKFNLNSSSYALRILFPECDYSSENQKITVKLVKLGDANQNIAIDDASYILSFPPDANNFTGAFVNQDQNAKLSFYIDLVSHDNMHLKIKEIGDVDISLSGFEKGTQVPFCNK